MLLTEANLWPKLIHSFSISTLKNTERIHYVRIMAVMECKYIYSSSVLKAVTDKIQQLIAEFHLPLPLHSHHNKCCLNHLHPLILLHYCIVEWILTETEPCSGMKLK